MISLTQAMETLASIINAEESRGSQTSKITKKIFPYEEVKVVLEFAQNANSVFVGISKLNSDNSMGLDLTYEGGYDIGLSSSGE